MYQFRECGGIFIERQLQRNITKCGGRFVSLRGGDVTVMCESVRVWRVSKKWGGPSWSARL